ncbi:murein DD-endopeptidase MepM/ murein hydrolase activator NlpD [Agromyces ramosus]|uniref:Murein DD-endopeptidase MepM/ murein hydrolase activator NlpD n=1 Tax=Agromyces ramosus TaxID=33879 RepID=A0A4Q7MP92_9MICO|nr:peptidoglycan DD-metalloendopeptidase family protein [Agromyces ramosus]RZS68622.1 murein DD-endopeptidase MepM/ murein hydrolase activator NlpD [Agromyces ramosus]
MLESPLVPDGSAPGTQVPLRPERPLTRREIRERETAEAQRLAAAAAAAAFAAPPPAGYPVQQAQAGYPTHQPPAPAATAMQQQTAPAATAMQQPPAPAATAMQQQTAPVAPAVQISAPQAPAPAQPAPQRPAFDSIFGAADAASHQAVETTALRRRGVDTSPPSEAEQADRSSGRSSASSVSPRRSTAPGAGSAARRDEAPGFDALFAGLGDDDADFASDADVDAPRGRRGDHGGRSARADRKAAKAPKAEKARKAPKAEKAPKAGKAGRRSTSGSAPAGPRRGASMPAALDAIDGDLASLVGGITGTAGIAATAASASAGLVSGPVARASSGVVPPADAAAGFAAAIAAAAGALPTVDPSTGPSRASLNLEAAPLRGRDRLRESDPSPVVPADVTGVSELLGFGATPEPVRPASAADATPSTRRSPELAATPRGDTLRADASRAGASRSRGSRVGAVRSDVRHGAAARRMPVPAASRPSTRPAASAPTRRRRAAGRMVSMVAMSFAALLAVATTIPSLSLLSPEDVQALALANYGTDSIDGQRVVVNGDIVAQSMQREGYEHQTIQEYAAAAGIRAAGDFTNNPAGTIQWPFAVGVHIGDHFGYRNCAGCSSDHGGQDFNPGLGAEIQAIADGTVAVSTDSGGSLGVVMMIDHVIDGELITSVYAHMEYDSRRFEVGDTVHVADVIGTTGDTGMSTGPHLHFEIRIGGVDGTKVDPLEWLYANTN